MKIGRNAQARIDAIRAESQDVRERFDILLARLEETAGSLLEGALCASTEGLQGQREMIARYVQLSVFESLTGYTQKAIRRKIEDGHWLEGKEYRRAPDGHILVDMEGYYKWVEGQRVA